MAWRHICAAALPRLVLAELSGAGMHVSILGGAGFLGRKVAQRLAADGTLGGKPVSSLTLFDLHAPPVPEGARFPVRALAGDLAELPEGAIPPETDVIFHLAAVVS